MKKPAKETPEKQLTVKDHEEAILIQSVLAEGLSVVMGLNPRWANEISTGLTNHMRLKMGAQSVWIPAPSKSERDAGIYRDFDGTNAAAVMAQYGVSRTRLYQIYEEQRDLHRAGNPVSS